MLLALALLLALLAGVMLFQANRRRQASGLPPGRVISTDTSAWGAVEQPLYDHRLHLTGRPDYLVETGGDLVPVEVKSARAPDAPYDSHIYQLAAYCLLVESHYGRRPPYGILKYANRTFAVDYTFELEESLLDLLDEMREQERKRTVARSHELAARCARCGYRSTCDQRLP
jgi:CRISPR-associated exonuclease Cas4